MTTEQQIDRERLRALASAATPGPWERGNWYHVQESTHCTCSQYHGPLVGIDPHGVLGEMHVHRYSDAPLWREGIRARDDATGGVDVVIESDEYGTMSDADAEFIAAAREAVPQLLDQLDQAEARIRAVEDVLGRHPDPRCDKHPGGDPITCGWKHAYADIRDALDSDAQP